MELGHGSREGPRDGDEARGDAVQGGGEDVGSDVLAGHEAPHQVEGARHNGQVGG